MESFDTVKIKKINKKEQRLGKVFKNSRGSGFKAAVNRGRTCSRTQPHRRQRLAPLICMAAV